MMKLLTLGVLALAASQVSAYCPNLCSGHGTCGTNDECVCYNYIGTARGDFYNVGQAYDASLQAAWTGADCSLRTCPLAFSWSGAAPNGLSVEHDTIADVAGGDYSFKIGTSDLTTFNSQTNTAFVRGNKIRHNGDLVTIRSATWDSTNVVVTTYEALSASTAGAKVYVGADENEHSSVPRNSLTANGAHSMLECAGQGICDRTTGNCECFPGYEGEACTRSVCPSDCSGNGICLSASRLATDAGHTYSFAWDNNKHFGCKCDLGFRGPDCSQQECPSDYDPLYGCGGGQCNAGAQDNANNDCTNKDISDCTHDEQRDCSGRGICDYESGVCKCFSGFFGEACEKQTILI